VLLPAVGWPRPATGGCHSVNQRKTPGRRPGVFRARADLIAPVFSRVAPDANEAPVGQSLGQSLATDRRVVSGRRAPGALGSSALRLLPGPGLPVITRGTPARTGGLLLGGVSIHAAAGHHFGAYVDQRMGAVARITNHRSHRPRRSVRRMPGCWPDEPDWSLESG